MSDKAVFGQGYAASYDHFYAGKDYAAECDFLEEAMRRYASEPVRTILDLGCGTGGHGLLLAQRGYQVTGVDRSETMLAAAQVKAEASGLSNRLNFLQGDIRALDLDRTYDAVIAMFAVMGYMTTNEDLAAALGAARRHLSPGGLLIFDAWSGPAVLTERPVDRYKIIDIDGTRIMRFVHPHLDLLQHTVDVHYKVLQVQGERVIGEIDEVHSMRFLFPQEVTHYLEDAGFRVRKLCPFMRPEDALDERDWNLAVVAEAR